MSESAALMLAVLGLIALGFVVGTAAGMIL